MTELHPNIKLLTTVDVTNIAGCAGAFSEDVVWHYYNPRLPALQGDYVGISGLEDFFSRLASQTNKTFKVNTVSADPVGDELVVVHTQNTMVLSGEDIKIDVVLVWRIVDGLIAEIWDIPSVHTRAD